MSARLHQVVLRAAHFAMALALFGFVGSATAADGRWKELAPVPDRIGFAGSFAGVASNALLLAGGANFPEAKPWEGGRKVWYDSVFVLENPDSAWRPAGRMPRPIGYGISLSHRLGVLCIGGSDARRHYASAFAMRWVNGRLGIQTLPELPNPCANLSGALAGDTVFVAGGIAAPDSTHALNTAYSLDLSAQAPAWKSLPPIPGPGRMLAVAGTLNGSFYVIGGAALKPGPDGKPIRDWLRDAWRFAPGKGWERFADVPRPVVAAPSPAPVVGGKFLVFGGDDGSQADQPPGTHNGFPRDVLAYDPMLDRWERIGEMPFSLVTTPAVPWNGHVVIPGGEEKPGVRSTRVWRSQTQAGSP